MSSPFDAGPRLAEIWANLAEAAQRGAETMRQQAGRAQPPDEAAQQRAEATQRGAGATQQRAGAPARAAEALAALWADAAQASRTVASALAARAGAPRPDPVAEAGFAAAADPRAWLALHGAGLEGGAAVLDAWVGAARRFGEALPGAAGPDGAAPDGKALLALWTGIASRALGEAQRSDAYLQAQAALLRAGTGLRQSQGDAADGWAAALGLPTRKELDEVHQQVAALRREVRALRRTAQARAVRRREARARATLEKQAP